MTGVVGVFVSKKGPMDLEGLPLICREFWKGTVYYSVFVFYCILIKLGIMIFEDNFNSLLTYQETYFGITLYSMEFGLPLIFVKEYKNAYLQKQDILLENKGKTGIYCW